MKTKFIEELSKILDKTKSLSEEEKDFSIGLIKDFYKEINLPVLSKSGPCINCKTEIKYNGLAHYHCKRGDIWLFSKINIWKTDDLIATVRFTHGGVERKINGLSIDTVSCYSCSDCIQKYSPLLEKAELEEKEKEHRKKLWEEEKKRQIVRGERKTTPSRQFRLMIESITPSEIRDLKSIPYKEFLKTRYWEIVRTYVDYKKGGVCELCNNKTNLDVHHRTYQHRGEEFRHLEDLILLCRTCHSRHHGKLGA